MPMQSPTRLHVGIVLMLGLLLVGGGVTYRNVQKLHDDSRAVAHSHEVLEAVERVLSALKRTRRPASGAT